MGWAGESGLGLPELQTHAVAWASALVVWAQPGVCGSGPPSSSGFRTGGRESSKKLLAVPITHSRAGSQEKPSLLCSSGSQTQRPLLLSKCDRN